VRDALGEPLAFASEGFDDACVLLSAWTREREVPLVQVTLPGGRLSLGVQVPGRPPARLRTDQATLMRIFAGRPAGPAAYELSGAAPAELVVF
jgi:hypothetical protein